MPQVHHPKIELFFFDAGGGHRSAATALQCAIAERHPDWRVTLVNLQNILEKVDPVYRLSKFQAQDLYNGILKRGWTYGSLAMLRGFQKCIELLAPLIEHLLRQHWQRSRPDLVVSVVPNFNAVMRRALRKVHPDVPYATVMTDLADCPPHFWQERQDQFIICGTDMAVRQAQKAGYPVDKIFRTSGMVLKPQFYKSTTDESRALRRSMGLDPALPTALVMFGGYSADIAEKIIIALQRAQTPIQTIVVCGHNEKLRRRLQAYGRCHTVGFTTDVPTYMSLADFFIGKPGPGSISEALHMGLPVILERNRKTLPQERYNTYWIEENGFGIIVKNFKQDIAAAVAYLIEKDNLSIFSRNIEKLNNRAVYEIPVIFEKIINEAYSKALDNIPKSA